METQEIIKVIDSMMKPQPIDYRPSGGWNAALTKLKEKLNDLASQKE